jgi:hypothetical protein
MDKLEDVSEIDKFKYHRYNLRKTFDYTGPLTVKLLEAMNDPKVRHQKNNLMYYDGFKFAAKLIDKETAAYSVEESYANKLNELRKKEANKYLQNMENKYTTDKNTKDQQDLREIYIFEKHKIAYNYLRLFGILNSKTMFRQLNYEFLYNNLTKNHAELKTLQDVTNNRFAEENIYVRFPDYIPRDGKDIKETIANRLNYITISIKQFNKIAKHIFGFKIAKMKDTKTLFEFRENKYLNSDGTLKT